MHRALLKTLALVALVAPAFAAEWLTDMEKAQELAAKEGKLILADFTGSDWCGYCVDLKRNVFDQPDFEAYVKDKYVLLEVDVPRAPKFAREQLERNKALCSQYKVNSFPTILVITSKGDVAGGFAGARPNLAAVDAELAADYDNGKALEAAYTMSGPERLQALFRCYKAMNPLERSYAVALRATLEAEDQQGVTGLKDLEKADREMVIYMRQFMNPDRTPQQLLSLIDEWMPQAMPANRPQLMEIKFQIQLSSATDYDGLEAARKTLLEWAEMCPERAGEIRKFIAEEYKDRDAMLRKIKEMNRSK